MPDKYGFVYLWFDRKSKRYYVGCRWGHENDGYVCSSPWMKNAYKHRPEDFKRRTLSRVYTTRQDLFDEEMKWLSQIRDNELGKRYYNLNKYNGHWSTIEGKRLTIAEKISASHKADPNWGSWSKGKINSEETKAKIAESVSKVWETPGYRENHIAKVSAVIQTEESNQARREKMQEAWQDPVYLEKMANRRGPTVTEDGIAQRIETAAKNGSKFGPKKGSKKPPKTPEQIAKHRASLIATNARKRAEREAGCIV